MDRAGEVRIGTSGWQYGIWGRDLYGGAPSRDWLGLYAEHFDTVEVNATFYRQIRTSTFEGWARATPAPFRFCIKAHRYMTHVRRLEFEPEALQRQKTASLSLGEKLAVILWQLPASLHFDSERLDHFLASLGSWPEVRHAIEFRHPSWFRDEVAERLARNGLAVTLSDTADWALWDRVTAGFVYARLHGHEDTYRSEYDDTALRNWAARIASWHGERRDVYVYFDNTASGAAWDNALRLKQLLAS